MTGRVKFGVITFWALIAAQPAHAENWILFNEPSSGIKMAHPKSWVVEKNPEEDCLVKFSGTTSADKYGEIKLSLNKDEIDPERLAEYTRLTLSKDLPGYKHVASTSMKFGRLGQFSGNSVEVVFNVGTLPVHQQYIFFKHLGKTYTLAFSSPEAGFTQVMPTYKQALAYLDKANTAQQSPAANSATKLQSTSSHATAGGAARGNSFDLVALEDATLPVSLSYPVGWRVSKEGKHDERGVKISGNGPNGQGAELHFWYGPRHDGSLDHLVQMVEDEYLKPLPQYQRITSTHSNVSGIDGVKQYSTFVMDGIPTRQNALFFADGKSFYCLTLTAMTWSQQELRDLFDRVVSSLKLR